MPSLRREIHQSRPFVSLAEEAFLNVWRTAEVLTHAISQALKPHGLTPTQYNVLRILRGAGAGGLPCREVATRLISRDPDVTRLLDRLEALGYVARGRDAVDRRVVTARITGAGLKLMAELDEPMTRVPVRRLGHMSEQDLRTLVRLLEQARPETGDSPSQTEGAES